MRPDQAPKLSLIHAFVALLVGAAVALGSLLWRADVDARRTILDSAERLRGQAARRIEQEVQQELSGAGAAIDDLEHALTLGAVEPSDEKALELTLTGTLARNTHLAEVSFTRATRTGFDKDGDAQLAPEGRFQVSVARRNDGVLQTRLTQQDAKGFHARERVHQPEGALAAAALGPEHDVPDPTAHLTFSTAASEEHDGEGLWSDLHFSELDESLPREKRRVVVSMQRSLASADGTFLGVARASLLTAAIDDIARLRVDPHDPDDPHQVFLADSSGRLITRLSSDDGLESIDGELRVHRAHRHDAIDALLMSPLFEGTEKAQGGTSRRFVVDKVAYLATVRTLADTQDWNVGIVVPESAYTGPLLQLRGRFVEAAVTFLVLLALGGGFTLLALRRGLGQIGRTAQTMRALDFTAAEWSTRFRDVHDVLDGLERAKTALRAMGRYVPVDLVKQLFADNQEPMAGGELRELTILFTDVAGFTSLAEKTPPAALAMALGRYFEVITRAVRESGGTIDKFIGDAVMALWNAPRKRQRHAQLACAAVLKAQRALDELFASAAWQGLPPLKTRFGLHTGEALVGHFGTDERLAYTALGDSVNLSARLEGLCKAYGVTVLVSESVAEAAREAFVFRLVDRVAVKGKLKGVNVYELVGERTASTAVVELHETYERAFAAYENRDFEGALGLLAGQLLDGPSKVLFARCRAYLASPPPPVWNATHVALEK